MAFDFGLSFQPGADQGNGTNQNEPQGPGPTPVQSAVKLLSLRLPSVVGAQAISPQALLQSPGSAGLGGGQMTPDAFLALLKKLMGQSGAQVPQLSSDGLSNQSGAPRMPTFQPSPSQQAPAFEVKPPNIIPPHIKVGDGSGEGATEGGIGAGGTQPPASEPAGVPSPFDLPRLGSGARQREHDEYHRG
jgi:hypothetical protein